MTTLQEYLAQESKEQLKEIIIGQRDEFNSDLSLITEEQAKELNGGELDLSEYPNLEKVWIWGNYLKSPLTKLELGNKSKLTQLACSRNLLTSLDLTNCPELKLISCWNNQLTNLDFLNNLQEKKLTFLIVGNNSFPESDLTPFSRFVNLEYLELYNNDFTGSLEPLKGMVKLENLNISSTDIDSGLEYLPESVKEFACSAIREDAKVKTIYNLFANEQREVETKEKDGFKYIKNFPQKLQEYKQKQEARLLLQTEFQTKDNLINQLQQETTHLKSESQQSQKKITELEGEIKTIHIEKEKAKQRITEIQDKLDASNENIDQLQQILDQLKSINLNDYQRLTKKSKGDEGKIDDSQEEWMRINFNENFIGKDNKEYSDLTFYKKKSFSYLWDDPADSVLWLKKENLLKGKDESIVFDDSNVSPPLSSEVQKALEEQWKKQQLQIELDEAQKQNKEKEQQIDQLSMEKISLEQKIEEQSLENFSNEQIQALKLLQIAKGELEVLKQTILNKDKDVQQLQTNLTNTLKTVSNLNKQNQQIQQEKISSENNFRNTVASLQKDKLDRLDRFFQREQVRTLKEDNETKKLVDESIATIDELKAAEKRVQELKQEITEKKNELRAEVISWTKN